MKNKFELIDDTDKLKAFHGFIGKTLEQIRHYKVYFNNESTDDDGDLELKFTDNTFLTFSIQSDGESITANAEPIKKIPTFEVSDNTKCTWKKILLNKDEKWNKVIGLKLIKIESIIDYFKKIKSKILSGVRLSFEKDNYIIFINYGDDAKFSLNDDSIVETIKDIETTFESIT